MDERASVVGDLLTINQHVNITCHWPPCRAEARWTAVEAVERLGFSRPWAGVNRVLRCSACGARGRDGFVTAHPCTLDTAAERLRWEHANGRGKGDLKEGLETLRKLLGGRGELGGDGPVKPAWPKRKKPPADGPGAS